MSSMNLRMYVVLACGEEFEVPLPGMGTSTANGIFNSPDRGKELLALIERTCDWQSQTTRIKALLGDKTVRIRWDLW